MPEIPEKPIVGGGLVEPAEAAKPMAEPAEGDVKVSPQAVPVAAKEHAAKDAVADTAVVAPVGVVPEPTLVVAATEGETKTPAAAATIRLERKHPLAIRWMHWVNSPVLFTMIWSGLLIYWNDSDNAYQHPHAVYRVSVESLTLVRLFQPWFWKAISAPYRVTEGLGYHFFFMWLFCDQRNFVCVVSFDLGGVEIACAGAEVGAGCDSGDAG
jgi:hypothetical protein